MKTLEDNLIEVLQNLKDLQETIDEEQIYNCLHLMDNMYKKTQDPHYHYMFHSVCLMVHHLGIMDAAEVAMLHTAGVEL